MSDFVELYGQNVAQKKGDLSVRVALEQPSRLNQETNLVYDVDQEVQFHTEKAASNRFRFYGSIVPTLNMVLKGAEKPNTGYFKFTDDNWQVALLKPVPYLDDRGKQLLHKQDVHEYDFSYGMPAIKVIPAQDEFSNYMAFNMYLGHNLGQDDRVYISSLDPTYLMPGYYNIIGVDGNTIYINQEYVEMPPDYNEDPFTTDTSIDEQVSAVNDAVAEKTIMVPTLTPPVFTTETDFVETLKTTRKTGGFLGLFKKKKTTTKEVTSKYVAAISLQQAAPSVIPVADNSEILHVGDNEIGVLNDSVRQELMKKRPNISKLIKPSFFVKKVLEDYEMEYYVKQAEVIAVAKELTDCAFSLSSSGEQIKNFLFEDVDLTGLTDNLGVPVTELIIAVVKKPGNDAVDISDVESNFEKIIDYTDLGHGLDTVLTRQTGSEVDTLKTGDKLLLGTYEYDRENLSEVQLNALSHRVIHKDVSFSYNPFYPVQVRVFSSYVEDSESKTNMPDYAAYSDIRQKYIWRDILDIGFFEQSGVGVDHRFLNGSFYIYNRIVFTLKNDYTLKYKYNTNDINKLDTGDYEIDGVKDILGDLLQDPTATTDNNKGYQEFKTKKC